MKPYILGGLAILATFLAGCLLGRSYRRTDKIIDTTILETVTWLRRQDTQVLHTEHRITAWRTKVIERPDGTKETETETREERDQREQTKVTETSTTAKETSTKSSTKMSTPRWELGTFGSLNRVGWGAGPVLGYRLAGPLWVAGAIDFKNKLGTAYLSLKF
jgi:hypothetical protein